MIIIDKDNYTDHQLQWVHGPRTVVMPQCPFLESHYGLGPIPRELSSRETNRDLSELHTLFLLLIQDDITSCESPSVPKSSHNSELSKNVRLTNGQPPKS